MGEKNKFIYHFQKSSIMSNIKIVLLFSLFFFLASVQALKAQDYPVIYEGPDMIGDMIYVDDDTFVAVMGFSSEKKMGIVKMNEDGEVLGVVFISDMEQEDIIRIHELIRLPDGDFGIYYLTREEDIVRLNLAKVNQDLDLTSVVFDWEGADYNIGNPFGDFDNYLMDGDGQTVFSYVPVHPATTDPVSLRLLKFDGEGNLDCERLMEDIYINALGGNYMVNAADRSGYRLVLTEGPTDMKHDCHFLDKDLNTVMVKRFIDEPIYPWVCGDGKFYLNPYNGKTYATAQWSVPAYNQNPAIELDILHAVFDEDFNMLNHAWSIHTPRVGDFIGDQPADLRAIDFSPDGKVYALASMDVGIGIDQNRDHNFYLAMFDENLNKEWEVLYHNNDYAGAGLSVCASPKGGCLVAIDGFDRNASVSESQYRLLRITESTILGIGEAEASTAAKAWPNPTTGTVRIDGEDVKEIQVFNQLGQCLKTAQDTNEVCLEGLPQGLYLLRITLEGGKVFSDKVVKE